MGEINRAMVLSCAITLEAEKY